MTGIWALAALWLGLALIASLVSIWPRVSTALSEIVVGTISSIVLTTPIAAFMQPLLRVFAVKGNAARSGLVQSRENAD